MPGFTYRFWELSFPLSAAPALLGGKPPVVLMPIPQITDVGHHLAAELTQHPKMAHTPLLHRLPSLLADVFGLPPMM